MTVTAGVLGRDWAEVPDGTLLEQVRAGHWDAYAELWRRHLPSAYAVASQYRSRSSVEDIVGEASLRVYDRIRAGKGPTSNFRSYFLTAVKSVAIDFGRVELRLVPAEPEDLEVAGTDIPAVDPAVRVDQDLVRVAFRRLSDREQEILWRTVVEGVSPAMVSTAVGLSANGVSVAALRARESLRERYLDAHSDRAVERAKTPECRWVLAHMGKFVRGKMRASQRARIERHLQDCRHARVLVAELNEINSGLPALLVPLIFVGGAASSTLWASAGLAAGFGGAAPGPQTPLADTSSLAGLATAGGAATSTVVAKTAAVVAAGAFGAGLVSSPGPGLDAFSLERVQGSAVSGPPLRVHSGSEGESDSWATGNGDKAAGSDTAAPAATGVNPLAGLPKSLAALPPTDHLGPLVLTSTVTVPAAGAAAASGAAAGTPSSARAATDATSAPASGTDTKPAAGAGTTTTAVSAGTTTTTGKPTTAVPASTTTTGSTGTASTTGTSETGTTTATGTSGSGTTGSGTTGSQSTSTGSTSSGSTSTGTATTGSTSTGTTASTTSGSTTSTGTSTDTSSTSSTTTTTSGSATAAATAVVRKKVNAAVPKLTDATLRQLAKALQAALAQEAQAALSTSSSATPSTTAT